MHTFKSLTVAVGVLAALGVAAQPADAQTVSTVFSLPTTLLGAQAGVIDGGDGYLYGTAYATNSVYKVRPDGTGFAIIHTFSAGTGNTYPGGQYPGRELVLGGDGALYGTATNGGANGNGTIYQVSRDGSAFSVLHSFSAEDSSFHNTDGATPFGGLALGSDGALYGTAEYGGASGRGTAFKIQTSGSGFQPLHQFSAAGSSDIYTNGSLPVAGLISDGNGNLYGTTAFGGANSHGTVYQLSEDGTSFTLLHSFISAEGSPQATLVRATDGRLYGTCFQGGANLKGLLFGLAVDGTGFQTLHTFTAYDNQGHNTDGAAPTGALAQGPDGALYGTTQTGGAYSHGGVYRVTTGGTFQPLISFGASTTDPNGPTGNLTLVGSTLYGTSPYGGSNGFGAIFAIGGFATTPTGPAAPTGLAATSSGQTALLTWTLGDSTDTNVLLERLSAGGNWSQIALLPAGSAAYQDPGLTLGLTYGYRVRVVASTGFSPYSNTASVTLAAPPPVASTAHLLWNNVNGTASVWNLSDPNPTTSYHLYGPYAGWTARAIAEETNGTPRLLWTNTSGQAALWNLADANPAATPLLYGPYTGWTAKSLAVGPDNVAHILWNNTSGQSTLWSIDSTGGYALTYVGPYTGWTATAISYGSDGKERLLWNNVSGAACLWNLADTNPSASSYVYGPFGGWTAKSLAVGPDNVAHLLWNNTSGQSTLWSVDSAGGYTFTYAGPYSGWSGTAIAVGGDNRERLLWNNVNGQVSVWNLSDPNPVGSSLLYGPYSGWSAVGISASR